MNPLTNAKNLNKINARELEMGYANTPNSWHYQYRNSAWIFIGGIDYRFTEGDVVCIFSQYGEPVNVNLVRDKKTGKSLGYAFLCYEDQLSTILAVDNLNCTKIGNSTVRVDHVEQYRLPRELQSKNESMTKRSEKYKHKREIPETDDVIRNKLFEKGCAPEVMHEYEVEDVKLKEKLIEVFGEDDGSHGSHEGTSKQKRKTHSKKTKAEKEEKKKRKVQKEMKKKKRRE